MLGFKSAFKMDSVPNPPTLGAHVQVGCLYRVPGAMLEYLKNRYGMAPSSFVTCRELEVPSKLTIDQNAAKYGVIEYDVQPGKGFIFVSGCNQYHVRQLQAFEITREQIAANQNDDVKPAASKPAKDKPTKEPKQRIPDYILAMLKSL